MVERERGGVYQTRDTCSERGETVLDILYPKYPEARPSSDVSLKRYMGVPTSIVSLYIMKDVMTEVSRRISRGDGMEVTDVVILYHWLLQYGGVSYELHRPCQVTLRGPHTTTDQQQGGDTALKGTGGRRSSLSCSGCTITDKRPQSLSWKEYGGMDLCFNIHGEWNGINLKGHVSRTYTSLLLLGKLCSALRWIMDIYRCGVYQTRDTCSKRRETVLDILYSKHPETRPSLDARLKRYMDVPLSIVPLDIMGDVMTEVGCRISSGAGLGVTDVVSLNHWIIQYREVSPELRKIVASITEWLANSCLPWTVYWYLIKVHLIGQEKRPIIRLVGIIKTWCCCFSKYILAVACLEFEEACGMEHLCGGLEASVNSGIHVTSLLG